MTTRLETADGTTWRFTPDSAPPAADRMRAVVRARVFDETTGEPIRQDLGVTNSRFDLAARVSRDGLVGLVGHPARTLPMLGTSAVTLDMRISSPGYVPLALTGALGPIAGFPGVFAPLDFGDIALHRTGVALRGRAVHRVPLAPPPLPGASVNIDALWSVLPPANWTPPALAEPPNIVALAPGFYAARGAATAIRQRALTPNANTQTLLRPAEAGARRLLLSDRTGLAAGGDLMIDSTDAVRTEVVKIARVEATPAPDLPSLITLEYACTSLHREGCVCVGVTPQAPSAPTTLARSAIAGDRVGFTAAAPAFADGAFIEIDDGVVPHEYQRVGLYRTTTDPNGYFRLPPIARVALVRLRVQSAGLTDAQPIVTLDNRGADQDLTVSLE
jgi:hypothetical protein